MNGPLHVVRPRISGDHWSSCRLRSAWHSRVWLVLILTILHAGCAEPQIEFHEVRQPSEVIRPREWLAVKQIIEQLPEPKLRQLPPTQPPLPQWQEARTLPVDELTSEERALLQSYSEPAHYQAYISRLPRINSLLQEAQLTREQFTGFLLSLSAAIRRTNLPEDFPVDDLIRRGDPAVKQLSGDNRLFASLSIEDRHRVLDDAVWLHRVYRAQRLQHIPDENLALVRKNWDWLKSVMPAEVFQPPFDDVVDLLETQGIPFVEGTGVDSDANIEWDQSDAIIGRAAL